MSLISLSTAHNICLDLSHITIYPFSAQDRYLRLSCRQYHTFLSPARRRHQYGLTIPLRHYGGLVYGSSQFRHPYCSR